MLSAADIRALLLNFTEEVWREVIQHRVCASRANRVSAKGRRVRSRGERVRAGCACQHAAKRQTRSDALCKRDHVRRDAVLLKAEQRPRAAYAGLHLVDEQQDIA